MMNNNKPTVLKLDADKTLELRKAWEKCFIPIATDSRDIYATDKEFKWTFVITHEDGWLGPYFARGCNSILICFNYMNSTANENKLLKLLAVAIVENPRSTLKELLNLREAVKPHCTIPLEQERILKSS